MTRFDDAVVKEAWSWVGTPYAHQASRKLVGTDCLGLILGVWKNLLPNAPEIRTDYSADWGETEIADKLLTACRTYLKEIDEGKDGCILLFRMKPTAVTKHLGIQISDGSKQAFIHTYGRHGVVVSPLSMPWRRKIAGRFVFPEQGGLSWPR